MILVERGIFGFEEARMAALRGGGAPGGRSRPYYPCVSLFSARLVTCDRPTCFGYKSYSCFTSVVSSKQLVFHITKI